MKLPKHMLGRMVELTWRDPGEARVSVGITEVGSLPRGRQALATWRERGIVTDITDGVVRIEHSMAQPAPALPNQTTEHVFTFIPEELIEGAVMYDPVKEPQIG